MTESYPYDIALSFAGEDRDTVEEIARTLKESGAKVFYDEYEKAFLWGKDLYQHLTDLYQSHARYCTLILSASYAAKVWTRLELKAAQARALREKLEYILPVRLDNTEIPGILPTVGYLAIPPETPQSVAAIAIEKLSGSALKKPTAETSIGPVPPTLPSSPDFAPVPEPSPDLPLLIEVALALAHSFDRDPEFKAIAERAMTCQAWEHAEKAIAHLSHSIDKDEYYKKLIKKYVELGLLARAHQVVTLLGHAIDRDSERKRISREGSGQ